MHINKSFCPSLLQIVSGISFRICAIFWYNIIFCFVLWYEPEIWRPVPAISIQSRSQQFSNYRDEKIQSASLGWWKWFDREFGVRLKQRIETTAAKQTRRERKREGSDFNTAVLILMLHWKLRCATQRPSKSICIVQHKSEKLICNHSVLPFKLHIQCFC